VFLGTSHASYTAWGESLASALTGDLLSPLAQSAAWMRAGAAAPIGWQSKALDPALGLHFNHARFYSAGLGRFTQASPLGADFEHLYGYGLNSSFGFTDINGLQAVDQDSFPQSPIDRGLSGIANQNNLIDQILHSDAPQDRNPVLTGGQVRDEVNEMFRYVGTESALNAVPVGRVAEAAADSVQAVRRARGFGTVTTVCIIAADETAEGWQRHHIFPIQFREWFFDNGVNIDDWIIHLPDDLHVDNIHLGFGGGEWNDVWDVFIREHRSGASLNEIWTQAWEMIYDAGIELLPRSFE
jgi:RHS repeat-associated protein